MMPSENQSEPAQVSKASHLADESKPDAETRLANAYTATPEPAPSVIPAPDSNTDSGSTDSSLNDLRTRPTTKPDPNRSVRVAAASSIPPSQQDSAASSSSWTLILKVIFIPMAASFLILGLMWSVVNGWFERLIF